MGVAVGVGVLVGCGVGVAVEVAAGVLVGVFVGVAVAVAVGAGVSVGATMGAQAARKRHRISATTIVDKDRLIVNLLSVFQLGQFFPQKLGSKVGVCPPAGCFHHLAHEESEG